MPSIKSQFEDCVKFDNTNGTANVGKSAGRDAEIYLPYHFVNQLVTFKKCSILPWAVEQTEEVIHRCEVYW